MSKAPYIASAAAVCVVGGAACYGLYWYRKSSRTKFPEEWKQLGNLTNIYAYPIKSCGPIELTEAECTVLGVRDNWLRDRTMVIVDEENDFIHARSHPSLLLVHPTIRNSVLTLEHPNATGVVHINLAEVAALQKPTKATVWGVSVPVYDCGSEASEWLTKIVGDTNKYKLMYYATDESRPLRPKHENNVFGMKKGDTGAFTDEMSYNLINYASIEDLNLRVKECKVTERNFRPNFVLKGDSKPYEEDNWKFVKIGENIFEVIKPCARCIMTTIDPETGERDPKSEPLETLKRYRQFLNPEKRKASSNSPCMGIQMALRSGPGRLQLNDPIYVAYKDTKQRIGCLNN